MTNSVMRTRARTIVRYRYELYISPLSRSFRECISTSRHAGYSIAICARIPSSALLDMRFMDVAGKRSREGAIIIRERDMLRSIQVAKTNKHTSQWSREALLESPFVGPHTQASVHRASEALRAVFGARVNYLCIEQQNITYTKNKDTDKSYIHTKQGT